MRTMCLLAVSILCVQSPGRTGEPDEARAIIGKAIKAMGLDKLPKDTKGFRSKTKGSLEVMGMTFGFTQNVLVRLPNQFKDMMELDANGKTVPVVTAFDGEKGWLQVDGKLQKLDDKLVAELKEAASMLNLALLTPLLDNKHKLSLVGETKVNDQPALGIRVSTKGIRDFNLFFDKKTSLLLKVERQAYDPMTEKEVPEERIVESYRDVDGRKVPHKVYMMRDGKKFLTAEVTEHVPLENIDPGEFTAPK